MFAEFVKQNLENGFVCENYDDDLVMYHSELQQLKLNVRVVPVTPIPGVKNDFGHYVLRFRVTVYQDAIAPINPESFSGIFAKCDKKEAATLADVKIVLEQFVKNVKWQLFRVASLEIK